jgi:hypothetical protein
LIGAKINDGEDSDTNDEDEEEDGDFMPIYGTFSKTGTVMDDSSKMVLYYDIFEKCGMKSFRGSFWG